MPESRYSSDTFRGIAKGAGQRQEQRLEQTRDKIGKMKEKTKRGWMVGIETEKGKSTKKTGEQHWDMSARRVEIAMGGREQETENESTRKRGLILPTTADNGCNHRWNMLHFLPQLLALLSSPSQNSRSAINVCIVARA